MNNHINIEAIKLNTKIWYDNGRFYEFQKRSEEEISSYLDALETGIQFALEGFGHISMSVYESRRVWNEISDYIDELTNESSKEWNKIENGE